MDGLEEGEIFDSANSDNEMDKKEQKISSGYSVVERKGPSGQSSSFDGQRTSSTAYRSRNVNAESSSDSNSDVDEDSPIWKQKKQKFLRKSTERQMDTRASPTLPEYTNDRRPSSLDQADKKKNNIWGSVLEEQTLTQSLAKSVDVENKNYIDFDCRTVESYDYRKKYKDSRPERTEDNIDEYQKPNPTDMFDRDARGNSGRSIIDYEDTVDTFKKKRNRGRKRKAEPEPESERKTGGIYNRLGAKKTTTVSIGEIDVSPELETDDLVKRIADFLHEPKVELIERVIDAMGKEAAVRIVKMTRDVEHAGGMFTFDGTRKRTPGGVFIQLTKQQPEFTNDVKKIVFKEDHDRQMEERKERRKRKKSKKKSKKGKGETQGEKSNSNSRSVSPTSSKSRSRENLQISDSDEDDDSPVKHKTETFDFAAELAAAKKQISEKKDKQNVNEEMEGCAGDELDKENINGENDMQELGEDVVDVLVEEDASID